ncbi:hypothetical protein MWU78_18595 [Arenibacter sp. F26102]|uniref:hypothetical protein n=1 Tax=Arenibacter sp. F26102 TaxID=2926416 RepID=UPI001FF42A55|nr:hypothetical protein [Arenibacter sp. F26102]MCK0147671.1 hypothetical protein [Arenibacter sp. F26102]
MDTYEFTILGGPYIDFHKIASQVNSLLIGGQRVFRNPAMDTSIGYNKGAAILRVAITITQWNNEQYYYKWPMHCVML